MGLSAAVVWMTVLLPAPSAEPAVAFKMHVINAESRFEAAGVADVNRDGKLDIVSGSQWYAAPDWKPHPLRDIEERDEYYVDFANLPLDVNGDGWTDIVSVAWHSQAVIWVENPGQHGGKWRVHEVDKPGFMETAVLVDLDRDGDPDVLPNVSNQVIWYEFVPEAAKTRPAAKDGKPDEVVYFKPHSFGSQGAGHGVGCGDVNGDKRVDIVTLHGWYEAPADARKGTWVWHGEWDLGATGIPILVFDVDGDNDSDVVWGMGHNYGMFWLEQKAADGKCEWTRHEIDKTWSQAHTLFAVDLDGDKQLEVVTGKRFRAHNGKDPGANDPRCLYWYKYDRKAGKWDRRTIEQGGKGGLGTGPCMADVDGDGDLDLIASGKSGLYLYENLLKSR